MDDFAALRQDLTANLSKSFRTPTKIGGLGHDGDDDDGSVPAIEFGTELALIRDAERLCLGKVGNGEKVCLKGNADCLTRSHRSSRMTLEHPVCFLVRHGESTSAFGSPCLDAMPLGNIYREQLLLRSESDWATTFAFITENGIQDETQEEAMANLTTNVSAQVMPRTPARNKSREKVKDEASNVFLNIVRLQQEFGSRPSPTVALDKWRKATEEEDVKSLGDTFQDIVCSRLERTGSATVTLGLFLQNLAGEHEENLSALEDSMAGLRGLLSLLKGSLGKQNPSLPTSHPTVWATVQGMSERLDNTEEVIKAVGLALRDLQDLRGAQASTNSQGRGNGRIHGGILRRNVARTENETAWEGGFSELGAGYSQGVHSGGSGNQRGAGGGGHGNGNPGGTGGGGQGPSNPMDSNGNSGGGGGGGRRPTQVNFDLDDFGNGLLGEELDDGLAETNENQFTQLGELEKRLRRLELRHAGQNSDQSVFFGNHIFNSRIDLSAFLEQYLGGLSIPSGLFPSPHQLLNLIFLELAGTLPGMKDFKALRDLGVSNREFSATMAAFKVLPAPFEANTRLKTHTYQTSGSTTARFKAIPSYVDWGLRSYEDSLSFKFNRELDRVEGKLQSSISIEFSRHPPLQVLASGMLRSSTRFVRGLFDYMTECYESLNSAFNSPSETWDLVCFSVEQLFMNEFTAARVGMVEEDFTDPRKLALDVIWSNLKCMSVVDNFNQCGVAKHPSMNGSQVRFVLKMAQNNNVGTLERKVSVQEKEIRELKELVTAQAATLSSIEGKMRSVESRADKACEAAGVPSVGRRGQGGRSGGGGGAGGAQS